jgi:hypothetical protein
MSPVFPKNLQKTVDNGKGEMYKRSVSEDCLREKAVEKNARKGMSDAATLPTGRRRLGDRPKPQQRIPPGSLPQPLGVTRPPRSARCQNEGRPPFR